MSVNKMDVLHWVDRKTEEGRFKGHPAARTVLKCYVEYMWTFDASSQLERHKELAKKYPKAKKMHVIDKVVWPAVVAKKCMLSKRAVELANKWLEQERFIKISWGYGPQGGKPMPLDIEILLLTPEGHNRSFMVNHGSSERSSYAYERSSVASEPGSYIKTYKDNVKVNPPREQSSLGVTDKEKDQEMDSIYASLGIASVSEPTTTSDAKYYKQTNINNRDFGKIRKVSGNVKKKPGEKEVSSEEYELWRKENESM